MLIILLIIDKLIMHYNLKKMSILKIVMQIFN